MSKLQYLDIHNNHIHTIESNAFAGLRNMLRVNLDYNKITTFQSNAFDGLHNLQRICFDNKFNKLALQITESKMQLRKWIVQRDILTELVIGMRSKDLPVLVVLEIAEKLIDIDFGKRLQIAWEISKTVKHAR